ncbi:MAG: cytochrome b/b6 domain-containing protein [Alkalinema sp. CAN_BIN05]|nr:cytochrome b/b6 domain-containing protein [Alkalinema sp. CAN_BIN05]
MEEAKKSTKKPKAPKQDLLAKVFHWINIISLLIMASSGLRIYNANPVFGGRAGQDFPDFLLLGEGLADGRVWHFAAMWIYAINLLIYGLYIFITKRWKNRFAASNDLKALQASANAKRKIFAGHKIVYTVIIPILLLAIVSGVVMYKPAQLHWIASLFGSWQVLRTVHFLTIPIVLGFTFVHSFLALKFGGIRLVKSMFV